MIGSEQFGSLKFEIFQEFSEDDDASWEWNARRWLSKSFQEGRYLRDSLSSRKSNGFESLKVAGVNGRQKETKSSQADKVQKTTPKVLLF